MTITALDVNTDVESSLKIATTEVTNFRKLKVDLGYTTGNTTRAGDAVESEEPVRRQITVSFEMLSISADTQLKAVLTAYKAKTALEIEASDGTTGVKTAGAFKVTKCAQEGDAERYFSVELKPCLATPIADIDITA